MKQTFFKRPLALLLCLVLLFGQLPLSAAAAAGTATVTIANHTSFDRAAGAAWDGTIIDSQPVSLQPGDTLIDVAERALAGSSYTISRDAGGYVTAIGDLSAGDATAAGSALPGMDHWDGWCGAVNGVMPGVGFGSVHIRGGDHIELGFSLDGAIPDTRRGSYNPATDGFSFDKGTLSANVAGWNTLLTLTVPADTASVAVLSIPNDQSLPVIVYNSAGDAYPLGADVPAAEGDRLHIVLGNYETVYEITLRAVGATDIDLILENIAAGYAGRSDGWIILGMAAYRDYHPLTAHTTTDAAKQAYLDYAAAVLADYTYAGPFASPDGEYAKAILMLTAAGIDPQEVYPAGSDIPLDAAALLKTTQTDNIYNAAYVLHAYHQGAFSSEPQEQTIIDLLLAAQNRATGAWGYELGGFNPDIDGTAAAIAALAPYRSLSPSVDSAIHRAVSWLSGKQLADGNFPGWDGNASANSSAAAMLALCALGRNPNTDPDFIKNGRSLLSGLLSLVSPGLDGFIADGTKNDLATEQGFRALIAAAQVLQTGGAFDIYDFSHHALLPGHATGRAPLPVPPNPVSPDEITVTFELRGLDGAVWVPRRNVTAKVDATLYHVFTSLLDSLGYGYSGASSGYVYSITPPNGDPLSEFGYGSGSGWLYRINNNLPGIGLTTQTLSDGDNILWYYTRDWVTDPLTGGYGASGPVVLIPEFTVTASRLNAHVSETQIADALTALSLSGAAELIIDAAQHDPNILLATFSIPSASVRKLASEAVSLAIHSPVASVRFSSAALAEIGRTDEATIQIVIQRLSSSELPASLPDSLTGRPVYRIEVFTGETAIARFGGGSVRVSLPYEPPEGAQEGNPAVYHIDEGGKQTRMDTRLNSALNQVVFEIDHFSLFVIVHEPPLPFRDVRADDSSYDAVRFVWERGLMNGVSAELFAPDSALTHAMFLTVLWRMTGAPLVQPGALPESMPDGQWFTPAAVWAVSTGFADAADPPGWHDAVTGARMLDALSHFTGSEPPTQIFSEFDTDGASTREDLAKILFALLQNGAE